MTTSNDAQWDRRRAWPDGAIAVLAARQHSIISRGQLLELGVRPRTIGAAVARQRISRVHIGVYSLVPAAARPRWAGLQAALLACGPSAVLSHHSAAQLHGLRVPPTDRIHVTVTGDRRHAGLRVHRIVTPARQDIVSVERLAVTSIARTVIDLAAELGDRQLEHLVDEARKRTSRAQLHAVRRRRAGCRGVHRIAALLDPERPSTDTWSVAEERLLVLLRRAGLPVPEVNVALGRYVPDLLWRRQRVIVEFDSAAHHSSPRARDRDAGRHNDLTAQGYQVIHVTWRDLSIRPEQVLVWVAVALSRGEDVEP